MWWILQQQQLTSSCLVDPPPSLHVPAPNPRYTLKMLVSSSLLSYNDFSLNSKGDDIVRKEVTTKVVGGINSCIAWGEQQETRAQKCLLQQSWWHSVCVSNTAIEVAAVTHNCKWGQSWQKEDVESIRYLREREGGRSWRCTQHAPWWRGRDRCLLF